MPTGRAGAIVKREFRITGGAGAQEQDGWAMVAVDECGANRVIVQHVPGVVALRAGGRAVPDAHPTLWARLDEEGIAPGANLGSGGEFEVTVGAGKDESQPAAGTGIVLVTDGCPTTRAHNLTALGAYPICIVHQALAGRAAVQLR